MTEGDADGGGAAAEGRVSPIGARRRLGVVSLVYLYRVGAALLVATPVARLAQDVVGGYPRGDAELFDPGGLMLMEAVRLSGPALSLLGTQTSLLAVALGFVGLLPLAALVHAMGQEGRLRWGAMGGAALRHLGTFSILLGLALLAQAGAAVLVVLLGGSLSGKLDLTGRADDVAVLATGVLAAALVLLIGVVHDLARVYAVHHDRGFYSATAGALRAIRRYRWRILSAYLLRGMITIGLLVGAGVAAYRLGWGTARQAWMAVGVHQVAIFAAVLLRASWLAAAMRYADRERAAAEDELTRPSDDGWRPPPASTGSGDSGPPGSAGPSMIRVRAADDESAAPRSEPPRSAPRSEPPRSGPSRSAPARAPDPVDRATPDEPVVPLVPIELPRAEPDPAPRPPPPPAPAASPPSPSAVALLSSSDLDVVPEPPAKAPAPPPPPPAGPTSSKRPPLPPLRRGPPRPGQPKREPEIASEPPPAAAPAEAAPAAPPGKPPPPKPSK